MEDAAIENDDGQGKHRPSLQRLMPFILRGADIGANVQQARSRIDLRRITDRPLVRRAPRRAIPRMGRAGIN